MFQCEFVLVEDSGGGECCFQWILRGDLLQVHITGMSLLSSMLIKLEG